MIAAVRNKIPKFKTIEKVDIIKAEEHRLDNGLPVYVINAGTQDLLRIEFVFDAGIGHQSVPLVASTTNALISEGTEKHSAEELADKIDFYGAFLETECGQDTASITLYSLNKHLKSTLPFIEEILKKACFPDEELNTYIQNKKQKFMVSSKKVDSIARKQFKTLMYGNDHQYGYHIKLQDYDHLKREYLLYFYNRFYRSGNCKIIVAGKVDAGTIKLLNKHFGGHDWDDKTFITGIDSHEIRSTDLQKHLVFKEDAVQSAIRVGKLLFNKTHPDYQSMLILNTVLGGYFGSRLMLNIREDKGYTYGIGSGITSHQKAGYFFIATEVGVDVCSKALDEIYFEIGKLRKVPVSKEELELVRNYLLGAFLRSVDGPFALADKFKNIMEYNLGYEYYDRFIHLIKTITPETLLELANKYLKEEELIELVVGKK